VPIQCRLNSPALGPDADGAHRGTSSSRRDRRPSFPRADLGPGTYHPGSNRGPDYRFPNHSRPVPNRAAESLNSLQDGPPVPQALTEAPTASTLAPSRRFALGGRPLSTYSVEKLGFPQRALFRLPRIESDNCGQVFAETILEDSRKTTAVGM
jgi:hypothetical protein